ncbi:TetR/AcrR family transcriptional regulator [Kineococcus sp. SYSU DK004]|uniref:TetR/AcrR family transcriptional regulator n=1 Tax=Kineococcus sp. SYSU DK004 TaxID=3383125 RepID=UPI003D7E5ECD
MPDTARPLRRDAERNRRLLLETAADLMARRGLDVSYEEIAAAAGTGTGTVYRRFPDRDDLVDALFAEHVDAVCAMAEDAARDEDAWRGLTGFLERQLEREAANRALGQILRGQRGPRAIAHRAHERMTPLVTDLIARAVRAGQLPAGVVPADLVAVHVMVGGVLDASAATAPDLWRRALAIALAGLQHAHLPGPAPGGDVVEQLYSHPDQRHHP